jgi:hypothetical protein
MSFYIDVDLKNVDIDDRDYMEFRCATCKEMMEAAFQEMDELIPILRFRCKRCEMDMEFKASPRSIWGLGSKDGYVLPD